VTTICVSRRSISANATSSFCSFCEFGDDADEDVDEDADEDADDEDVDDDVESVGMPANT